MIDSSPYGFKDFAGSSHWLLIRAVRRHGARRRMLVDIGASDGELGDRLREDFDTVVGIEGDSSRIEALHQRLDHAVIADLNQLDTLPEADAFVLADILEHLPRPEALLLAVRESLSEDGRLYLSVPNVANVTVRLGLLLGRWNYADRGILDRTHLRFYTRRTILAELEQSGFTALRTEATTMPIRLVLEGRIPESLLHAGERVLHFMTRLFPRFFGYQWVITAKSSDS